MAIHPDDDELFRDAASATAAGCCACYGGATRQEFDAARASGLREEAPATVLIHDAVRPFVDAALIDRIIAAIGERQAALPALPVADTLKREAADGTIQETVPRAGLHAAQTPQGFPFWPILAAHEKAHRSWQDRLHRRRRDRRMGRHCR